MPYTVRVNSGQSGVALPDGMVYDGPTDVYLTDEHYHRLHPILFVEVLTDLGPVASDPSFTTITGTVEVSRVDTPVSVTGEVTVTGVAGAPVTVEGTVGVVQQVTTPASMTVTGPVTGQVIVPGVAGQTIRMIRNAGHVDPALTQGIYPLVTIRLGNTVVYHDKLESGLPWSETVAFLSQPGDALTIDVDQDATIYLNMRVELQ